MPVYIYMMLKLKKTKAKVFDAAFLKALDVPCSKARLARRVTILRLTYSPLSTLFSHTFEVYIYSAYQAIYAPGN